MPVRKSYIPGWMCPMSGSLYRSNYRNSQKRMTKRHDVKSEKQQPLAHHALSHGLDFDHCFFKQ